MPEDKPLFHDDDGLRTLRHRREGRPSSHGGRPGRGGRRRAAADLRRAHPGPVPGRHLVGARARTPRTPGSPAAASAAAGEPRVPDARAGALRRRAMLDCEWEYGRSGPARAVAATTRTPVSGARTPADRAARSAGFDRPIDTDWRRTSYSGLIRAEEQAVHAVERARGGRHGRRARGPTRTRRRWRARSSGLDHRLDGPPSPMDDLPAGATFGSLVHAVLEHADPHAPDLEAELRDAGRGAAALVVRRRHRRRARRGAGADAAHVARSARRRAPAARHRLPRPAPRARLRVPAGGGDRRDRRARCPCGCGRGAAAPPAGRRPDARLRRPAGVAVARRPGAAGLPQRLHRRRAARPDRRAPTTATSSSTTRPTCSATPERPLTALDYTPALHDRGDAALALPAAGDALLRCRCTATCAGGCPATTRSATSAASSTSTSAACAARRPRWSTATRAGCSPGSPPAAMVIELSDLLAGGALAELLVIDDRARPPAALGARLLATSTRPTCSTPPTSTSPPGSATLGRDRRAVLLAAALAVRAVRRGRSASTSPTVAELPLEDDEPSSPGRTRGLGRPRSRPARWSARRSSALDGRAALPRPLLARGGAGLRRPRRPARRDAPEVDDAALDAGVLRRLPRGGYDEQRAAARAAAGRWTTVLTGGPGTGKTTTVAGLLALLAEQHEHGLGPAAPPDRAVRAHRQGVRPAAGGGRGRDRRQLAAGRPRPSRRPAVPRPCTACSAGARTAASGSGTTGANRLPHDVIVVDETSMVSLTMMARLLEAVRPDARLVLVGDPDQLSSVEAGAVLADLVRARRAVKSRRWPAAHLAPLRRRASARSRRRCARAMPTR